MHPRVCQPIPTRPLCDSFRFLSVCTHVCHDAITMRAHVHMPSPCVLMCTCHHHACSCAHVITSHVQEVPATDAQTTLSHLLSFLHILVSPPIALATTPTRPSHPPPLQQQQGARETAAAAAAEEERRGHERADDDGTGGGGEGGEDRGSDCGVGRVTGSGRGAVVVMQGDAALRACHLAVGLPRGISAALPAPLHASPEPFPSEQLAVPPGEAMARCFAATPLSVLSVSAACSAGENSSEGSRPHDSQTHGSLLTTNTPTHELLRFSVPSFLLSVPDTPSPHLHYPWLRSLLATLQSRVASCPSARYGAPNEGVETEDGRRDSGGSGSSSTIGVPNGSAGVGAAACKKEGTEKLQEERETTSCCTGAIMCQVWKERQQQAHTEERHSSAWWCWEQLTVAVTPAETSAVVL
ncbi:unnamed protein product [Closterium sp. Yama58-4]|nr:unnamed protein product [Closterium sp. Yama58-4]